MNGVQESAKSRNPVPRQRPRRRSVRQGSEAVVNRETLRVSVFGLGKLGLPLAALHACKGARVVGVDVNEEILRQVRSRTAPFPEPGLQEILSESGDRLSVASAREAVMDTEISEILVPTPSEPDGSYSLRFVRETCREIGRALAVKSGYHVVSLKSTVLPGSMDRVVKPELERASGKRAGADFGLCYNPAFIALGSVIRDFQRPDLILLGESDPRAGDAVVSLHRAICDRDPPIVRMNFTNAEIAKIAVNTFVTMKITFANLLARVCEAIPGADVDVVTGAIGKDSRIGGKYLRGGLPYGGPCFPRDNAALAYLARSVEADFLLAEATDAGNRSLVRRLAERVARHARPGGTVAVLGLSYKPDTNVVDESPGLLLCEELLRAGFSVRAFDPLAIPSARAVLADRVAFAENWRECVRPADVAVIATPWREFAAIDPWSASPGIVVIDGWRILAHGERGGDRYVVLGRGPSPGSFG